MKDQRQNEIEIGGRVVALIGSGVQVVGKVSEIREGGVLISCEMSLALIPGQPPPVLALPGDTECRQPEGKQRKSFLDSSNRKVGLGDDICCLMNIGVQIVATIIEVEEPSTGGGIVTGLKRGGQAVLQARSGYIVMAGEFILPFYPSTQPSGLFRAPCLLLSPEGEKVEQVIN